MMMASLNMVSEPGTVVSNEETFAAALIVAPEELVEGGAPTVAASGVTLLAVLLVATLL